MGLLAKDREMPNLSVHTQHFLLFMESAVVVDAAQLPAKCFSCIETVEICILFLLFPTAGKEELISLILAWKTKM